MKQITLTSLLALLFLSAFAQLNPEQTAQQTPLLLNKGKYLMHTQWDQWGLYAQYTPKQEVLGCWSTALAQILYYHRLKPTGSVDYTCTKSYTIKDTLCTFHEDYEVKCTQMRT